MVAKGRGTNKDDPDARELDALAAKLSDNIGTKEKSQASTDTRTAWSVVESEGAEPIR